MIRPTTKPGMPGHRWTSKPSFITSIVLNSGKAAVAAGIRSRLIRPTRADRYPVHWCRSPHKPSTPTAFRPSKASSVPSHSAGAVFCRTFFDFWLCGSITVTFRMCMTPWWTSWRVSKLKIGCRWRTFFLVTQTYLFRKLDFLVLNRCEVRGTTGASASIKQKAPSHSINQSTQPQLTIHFYWWCCSIKQSINQLIDTVTFQVYSINQSINQSRDYHFKFSFLAELSRSPGSDSFLHRFRW